jgi:hypothetical protein
MRSYKGCRAALSRVSDEIGVANACTWMYWPGFLWSKDCETKSEWLRARLNRFISREPKGHTIGLPFLWCLSFGIKERHSRAYSIFTTKQCEFKCAKKRLDKEIPSS